MIILKKENIKEIVNALKQGKVLVFPTETSYGMGCDATNQESVERIFQIKNRTKEKPLLVVVDSIQKAKKYLKWNETIEKISKKYWENGDKALTVVGEYLDPTSVLPLKREEADELREQSSHPPLFKEGLGEVYKRIIGNKETLLFRQKLRKDSTTAEKILWKELKGKKLGGLKIRRQHGIGLYIVDFYESKTKTVIELDGDVHFSIEKQEKKDQVREKYLEDNGYKIIRFNNVDIFNNLDGVLKHLYYNLTSPNPLLEKRGRDNLVSGVVSNEKTLALRVTKDLWLKDLCEKFGGPIVATSANIAGEENIYNFKELKKQFSDKDVIIINSGNLEKKPSSTLVSIVNNKVEVLRQGEIKILTPPQSSP